MAWFGKYEKEFNDPSPGVTEEEARHLRERISGLQAELRELQLPHRKEMDAISRQWETREDEFGDMTPQEIQEYMAQNHVRDRTDHNRDRMNTITSERELLKNRFDWLRDEKE